MGRMADLRWAPTSCTLPSVKQPLREQEFATLFSEALSRIVRIEPSHAILHLHSDREAAARDLAGRETSCCSFFSFEFHRAANELVMRVGVPAARADVLAALLATAERDTYRVGP